MIRSRLQRGAMALSASALALGLVTAGVAVGTAGATAPTPGVTSTSVTIGATVPLSGIAVSYSTVSAAANAVFKYVNAKGGVNHRKITFIRKDDCYNLAAFGLGCTQPTSVTTLNQTQSLVASSGVFATVGSLGTQAQDSVRAYLKSTNTPQLFVNSGSSDWNLPGTYPRLFGFQTSYIVEGKIFANYIKTHFAGQKVGFIGQNDDFGANGYTGLTTQHKFTIDPGNKFLYNPFDALGGASDIVPAILALKAHSVKVVVLDSIPPVTTAILLAAKNASFTPKWVISSVGSNPLSVHSATEAGAITFNSLPATNDKTNIWNVWLRKVLLADKADFPTFTASTTMDANFQYGAAYAVAFCEALYKLGANVTQAGIVSALTSTTFATPGIVPLKYSATNHQGILGGVMAVVSAGNPPKDFTEPSHVVYSSTDASASPITTTVKYTVAPIPAWLK